MLTAAADLLTDPDDVLVRRLGVDEHRYRSVPLRLALHRAGRSDEALPHARAAVRLNSPYAPFYYHLGVVEAAVGNATEARAALRRALALNPEFSRRHAAEARHCCCRWSRHDRAVQPCPAQPFRTYGLGPASSGHRPCTRPG